MRSNGRAFKGRRAASVSTGAVVAVTADRTKRCEIGVRSRAPAEDSGQFESIATTVLGQWPSRRTGRGRLGGLRQSTWTGSPKGEQMGICEWSRWEASDMDPRLKTEPVGTGESINLKARPRLSGCVTASLRQRLPTSLRPIQPLFMVFATSETACLTAGMVYLGC